jgi:hypothetical protein
MPTVTPVNTASGAPATAPAITDASDPRAGAAATGYADASTFTRVGDPAELRARLDQTLATLKDMAGRGEFVAALADQCMEHASRLGDSIRPTLRGIIAEAMDKVGPGRDAAFYDALLVNLRQGAVAGDFEQDLLDAVDALAVRIKQWSEVRPLDQSGWSRNRNLRIHEATTARYSCTWTVNNRTWDFRPGPDGWVSDCFVIGRGNVAAISWNIRTGQVRAAQAGGNPFSANVARACADWARRTIFPGIRLETLTF